MIKFSIFIVILIGIIYFLYPFYKFFFEKGDRVIELDADQIISELKVDSTFVTEEAYRYMEYGNEPIVYKVNSIKDNVYNISSHFRGKETSNENYSIEELKKLIKN